MKPFSKFLFLSPVKTLWFNLRGLPFRQAIHFPILVARGVRIEYLRKNSIELVDVEKLRWGGVLRIGFQDLEWSYNKKSVINIQGSLTLKGKGVHSFAPGLSLSIASGAFIELGDNFSCSHNTRIQIFKSLIVGDNNMWSFDNIVMDTDSHQIYNNERKMISHNAGIVFGDHVWLGCRCIVLKGVKIANGCIIGAGSIVSKSLQQERAIYVGNNKTKEGVDWSVHLNYDSNL